MALAPRHYSEERDGRSPARQDPVPVELPWDLTWDDLRGRIPTLHRPIGAFRTHKIQGLHQTGRSQILTIRYAEQEGRLQNRTIFLKLTNPARPEIPKYRYLMSRHAPVAPPLGAATTAAGEILMLQFLPTIGTTPDQADDLLELIATINGISNPPANIFRPPPGTSGYEDRIHQSLIALLPTPAEASRWLRAYRQAAEGARQMPLALNHNELSYQQVGWTAAPDDDHPRLVVFDLETMSLRPQYTDLAGMLPSIAAQTGRAEQELFNLYLEKLDQRTGETTDRRLGWSRMLTLRIVRTFESLPWLTTMIDTAGIEAPEHAVARLGQDLIQADLE
ncbi:hypothetical protein [Microlunatus speluncae]|uniref:hypothetical protein n=1 Tax=Microlunatus speluncae TaxID=2594267 RepID=UPI001266325A|nr:hypothetical protein [Microlunatus speluncae]